MNLKFIIIILCLLSLRFYSQNIDIQILKSLNEPEHPKWDMAMRNLSQSVYPTIVIIPGTMLITGYVKNDTLLMKNGIKTIVAIGLSAVITIGLKYTVNRTRPYAEYPNDIIKRTDTGPYSFPSGHTAVAFAMATSLTQSTKKWYVAIPAYTYASMVGYSRMRLGVHYPSDVLGGAITGIGSSLLVFQIEKWLNKKKR